MAQGQLLQVLPPVEQVHAAPAVQGLDGKLQGRITLDGSLRGLPRRGGTPDGYVVAAALGIVRDVGQDGFS